jgi:hypothetical protein
MASFPKYLPQDLYQILFNVYVSPKYLMLGSVGNTVCGICSNNWEFFFTGFHRY